MPDLPDNRPALPRDPQRNAMLAVISPAKRLSWAERPGVMPTEPLFQSDANRLARVMRRLSAADLRALMDISDDLATLNVARFKAFAAQPDAETTRPAAFAFAGDTYVGLEMASLCAVAVDWAQHHLRILSGLYGLLRPLDAIQPYRLEMGSRLATPRGATLVDYWGKRIARALNLAADAAGSDVLLNCASIEYFAAVDRKALKLRVITPIFLEGRESGEARIISFFAKKARGALARFVMENRLTRPQDLHGFASGGYRLDPGLSSDDRPVFRRAPAPPTSAAS